MKDRRVYVVEPTEELLSLLSSDPEHPLRADAAILAPELDFESDYEGWRKAWEAKAKSTFVADVISDWCDNPHVASLVTDLQTRSHADAFDSWWTIREIDYLTIEESWRPS